MQDVIDRLLSPDQIATRAEVLASPSPVPRAGGVYGWWFRSLPAAIDTSECVTRDGLTLLYVGISPTAPPANGRPASQQNLRKRIQTHYGGNAEGSTLRRTLGCLLAKRLGIELRRVGSGTRFTFLGGEQTLSGWMAENALVSWVACDRPWEIEHELIATLDLPLNLDSNARHVFHPELSRIRFDAMRRARDLSVAPNPGVGGRLIAAPKSAGRFSAFVRGGTGTQKGALARLVLVGAAASVDRGSIEDARLMLGAAIAAVRDRGVSVAILATPAGFVDDKPGGSWPGRSGWETQQADFDALAARASSVAADLVTSELRELARGVVDYLVLGIDVWPSDWSEPHAEVACLYEIETASVRPVTGKTYPTSDQQDDLIRNANSANHIVEIGEERLAILVCHDLAAWSPRGNANARGLRAETWLNLQAAVADARPTLAVQMPHTVNNARTWQAAWATFGRLAGSSLRAGTTAIRHLDQGYNPVPGPFDPRLLDGTGWGDQVIDVVVGAPADLTAATQPTARPVPRPVIDAQTSRGTRMAGTADGRALTDGSVPPEGSASVEDSFVSWARRARKGDAYGPWRVVRKLANGERLLTKDAARPPKEQVTHHYGGMCVHRPRIPASERLFFMRIGGPDDGDNGIMHAARRCHRTIERIKGLPSDLDLAAVPTSGSVSQTGFD